MCVLGYWPLFLNRTQAHAYAPNGIVLTQIILANTFYMPFGLHGVQYGGDCPAAVAAADTAAALAAASIPAASLCGPNDEVE